ncbi:SdpI family protein [Gracilimonas sp.]|uniref:SdpI family protein n=1 Tax=Gracilimonas sp. TaxID=1974203 RepID=UPI003BAD5ED7
MNTINILRKEWPVIVLLMAPFIASLLLSEQVPETVPTHFNLQGEADDYGPKWIILYLLPAIGVILYVALLFLPRIDPKKRIEEAQKPIAAIRLITSLFMVGLYAMMMLVVTGSDVSINSYVFIAVGVLFVGLGNYINTVKPNYFIGIRTPWTLENPTVWKKTHRLGSKIWMAGGVVIILSDLLFSESVNAIVFGATFGFMVVIPLLYSYFEFKKLESTGENT